MSEVLDRYQLFCKRYRKDRISIIILKTVIFEDVFESLTGLLQIFTGKFD